jgi:hypothetical protein
MMKQSQSIVAKSIASAIQEPLWYMQKVVQTTVDANLHDVSLESVLQRFQEVRLKCQEIERIINDTLPDLAGTPHKPDRNWRLYEKSGSVCLLVFHELLFVLLGQAPEHQTQHGETRPWPHYCWSGTRSPCSCGESGRSRPACAQ